jgi:hypothetical protein
MGVRWVGDADREGRREIDCVLEAALASAGFEPFGYSGGVNALLITAALVGQCVDSLLVGI